MREENRLGAGSALASTKEQTAMSQIKKIVIVGNGVAGIRAALVARQRDRRASISVVSGETDYFFSRTALMYAFMDRMTRRDLEPHERGSYAKQGIALVRDWAVDLDADAHRLTLESGRTLDYDRLVLAVGARPNVFSWPGIESVQEGLVHFVSMQDLDHCERLAPSTREAAVVGGGLIGIELVECLSWHGKRVTFLIRDPYYWPVALGQEEAQYVNEHMREHGVDVRFNEELACIESDPAGRVKAVVTSSGDTIPCQMLGVCIGVRPNVERIAGFRTPPKIGRGIVVNEFLETSLPDVYACGDCAEIHTPQEKPFVELIWYSAKRQGELVGRNLFGDRIAYRRPVFFNSSKFFEIEYTTVGEVMSLPDGMPTIYRKMPGRNVSQRIVHDGEKVLGFNMLGSRWNHEILSRWIEERRSAEFCLEHLRMAQFDVELGRVPLHRMEESAIPLHKKERPA
jgi:NAD(P)H-nitrite reductase large subunit